MAGTTLSDIIIPEVFNPYLIVRTAELSNIITSGIAANDAEFDRLASQAAPTINMPFFADLMGESEQVIESADLSSNGIDSKIDVAAIIRRAKMWTSTDLSATMAGKDPMGAIATLVAGFWARDMQKELIAILNGVFASASMSANILDISSKTGAAANWSASNFIDAQQCLGDNQEKLTAIAMHSATRAALLKDNLIQTMQPSTLGPIDTYQGKQVIVDDGCPVDTATKTYTTYLFGAGAIALGNGTPDKLIPTEVYREPRKGSGVDYLINRRTIIMHPRGVKFTNANVANAEGPSRIELADGTNWDRAYEPKQIRIVQFKHKLA